MIKGKKLKDIECMGGTSWKSIEEELNCPYCGEPIKDKRRKCQYCKSKLKFSYGYQQFIKVEIE